LLVFLWPAQGLATPGDDIEDEKTDSLFTIAKSAVTDNEFGMTDMVGYGIEKTLFKELPRDGAVLIGFDVGVGKFTTDDMIYALRPIYLTAKGESSGKDIGKFGGNNAQKSSVKRIVQIKAKPGYAVASIRMQKGLFINSIRLVYRRLNGNTLSDDQAYASPWVGTHDDKEEHLLDGGGEPIIGVFGNRDEKQILALGIYHLPERDKPLPAEKKEKRPKSTPNTTPKQTDSPTEDKAQPQSVDDSTDVPTEETPSSGGGIGYLPLIVFGIVAILLFLVFMLVTGKKKPVEESARETTRPRPNARPANDSVAWVLPADPNDPAWRDQRYLSSLPEYQTDNSGAANLSKMLGFCGLLAWCLPIVGLPLSITGLVFGIKGLKSAQAGSAMAGIMLNSLALIFSLINAAAGIYMAMHSHSYVYH
jgi:hypothetical protein